LEFSADADECSPRAEGFNGAFGLMFPTNLPRPTCILECEQFCSSLKTHRRRSSISAAFRFAFFHAALSHERNRDLLVALRQSADNDVLNILERMSGIADKVSVYEIS
jgi:hypothetical protein